MEEADAIVPDVVHSSIGPSMKTPSREVMELWEEVSDRIDGGKFVDATKARLSLAHVIRYYEAIRFYKDPSSFTEARTFVGKYVPRIVRILLDQVDIDNLASSEKARVKSCLESAILLVAYDLKELKCQAVSLLKEIFDEVSGYGQTITGCQRKIGIRNLIFKFIKADGLENLILYLDAFTETPLFPDLETVSSILNMLDTVVEQVSCGGLKFNCKWLQSVVSRITELVMVHLVSLDETTWECLNDEFIDLYKRMSKIRDVLLIRPKRMLVLHRDLIRRLIGSSSLQLKQVGWRELQQNIVTGLKPSPPEAYLVVGAGIDFVNGRYELNPSIIGRNVQNHYVMHLATKGTTGKTLTLFPCTMRHSKKWWFISEADEDAPGTDKDIDYYQYKSENATPPRTGWVSCVKGVDPPPTLIPIVTLLDEDLFDWIFGNNVLEMSVRDTLDTSLDIGARRANMHVQKLIEELLNSVLKSLHVQSELEFTGGDVSSSANENAIRFAEMTMQHLVLLDSDVLELDETFIIKTCQQLKQIYDDINPCHCHTIDFRLYQGLMALRLSTVNCTSNSLVKELQRVSLENYLPQAYLVEGAGTAIANGRYDLILKADKAIVYTKMQRYNADGDADDDGDQFLSIHRALQGPELGRWVITQHEGPLDHENYDYLYDNINEGNRTPPEVGWIECDSDWIEVSGPPPTLTAIGLAELKTGMTQQQCILWSVVLRLFLASEMPVTKRTFAMKESILLCLASLNKTKLELQQAFVSCAYKIIGQLFNHIERKRQMSITHFLVDRKSKRQAQGDVQVP